LRAGNTRIAALQEISLKISNLAALARIIKEWGVKGQMKALPLIDSLYFLPPESTVVLTFPSGASESMKIESLKKMNRHALVSFYGINDPQATWRFRGATLCADTSLLPALLPEEYYYEQLIGLTVYSADGNALGKITDIFETGSNDVYVVKGLHREYLIPAIRDVVKEINLEAGRMIIEPLQGLID
jgi:16S rRNA processing protein RimM